MARVAARVTADFFFCFVGVHEMTFRIHISVYNIGLGVVPAAEARKTDRALDIGYMYNGKPGHGGLHFC